MHEKRRVAIIGTVGIPARYGGFETLAENLVVNLASKLDLTVYCSAIDCESKLDSYEGAKLRYIQFRANGIQSIFYDVCSLASAMWKSDVLVVLGVSGAIFLPFVRLFSRSIIVTNVDGVEWKREKWGIMAKTVLRVSEWFAARFSHCVIGDNPAIQEHLRKEYGCPSEYIAYGGDHVEIHSNDVAKSTATQPSKSVEPYALALCRIEPENNVHLILEAFSLDVSPIKLVFVGNWDSSDYGRELKAKYSVTANIEIREPTYDIAELYSLRKDAQFYVHGHSAGGTNPALVEAMYMRIPVFAFDVAYNRHTTKNRAFYFKSAEELLRLVCDTSEEAIANCGEEMGNLAGVEYAWKNISMSYLALISRL